LKLKADEVLAKDNRKFDSRRVVTRSDPAVVRNAVLFAMNKEAVKMVI